MVKQKEVLSKNQVQELIDNAGSYETQLMIMTMVQTGMRVSELINFKKSWIIERDEVIHIQTNTTPIKWAPKRDSERKVPINRSLLINIKRHLGKRKKGYIFQSNKQTNSKQVGDRIIKSKTHGRYTYRSIIRKINTISLKTLGMNIGTHVFRATYASYLLKMKLDLESIRKLLGHSDIKTTLIYLRGLPDYNSWEEVRRVELMDLTIKNV
ncbi:MAG: tyrosine-type recombinase/integrase [Candidatus Helarchaeota archaeon]